jgi:hypothetical protein
MSQSTIFRLLSKRNILGAVLIAGIAAGIYLADLFKGLLGMGGGSGVPSLKTPDGKEGESKSKSNDALLTSTTAPESESESDATSNLPAPDFIKVIIADKSYFLRSESGDHSAPLKQIISQAKSAPGDEDGIRVRVYRKLSSLPSAEIALRDALIAAGISDKQTDWIPNPIDD